MVIKEFILKFKIKQKQKRILKLKKLKNLQLDLEDCDNELIRLSKDLHQLGIKKQNKIIEQDKEKIDRENLTHSIFNRCDKCDKVYLKSEAHFC